MKRFIFASLFAATAANPVFSHEFWVEPLSFQTEVGTVVDVDLRVGIMLNGRSYPFLTNKFFRYDVTVSGETTPLKGREGDLPSIKFSPEENGLNVISYHARPEKLEYDDFTRFVEYVTDEGLPQLVERHAKRGLPETGFIEGYERNSKALVQVGPATADQRDQAVGLPFELVALENPYLGQTSLPVKLLWQGEPVPDYQVAAFERHADGSVDRKVYKTDAQGVARIPVGDAGMYVLSSVYLEEKAVETTGEAWHSTWAALTFGRE